jgi:phage capsid family
MGTDDTALGHQKGEKKKEQTLKSLRRDIKGKAIYKRLDIDLQDIFDDSTGELLKFRVEELADRVANAIVVGALLTAGTGKDATLEGTRGLYPVVADAGDASGYGSKVVTKVDAASKTEYEIGVEVVESVKDKNNQGKILIVPEGFRRKIRLMKDSNGNIMFAKVKLEELFEVKAVYELPELNSFNSGKVKAIAYVDQAYVTMGENNATVRTDFDLDYNQDVMLTERYIGGSAQGYKTFAVAVEA